MIYQATIENAEDDSGNGILTFSPEMLVENDWKKGDTIEIKKKNGLIHLYNVTLAFRSVQQSYKESGYLPNVANKQQLA